MTVVAGFVGTDGAVLVSDSEGTESLHTRRDVEKIWKAGGLVMGYTGTDSVKQPLAAAVEREIQQAFGESATVARWEGRAALEKAIGPVLRHCYENHVGPMSQNGIPTALEGTLLVVGRDDHGYWLLEVDGTNQCTFYTDYGFHAVGSGSAGAYMALGMMKDYASAGRPLAQLKLIAHRTIQTCIETMGGSMGVGGYVQLWYSDAGGAFRKAPVDECEAIANGAEDWRGIERESLAKVVAPQRVPPDDAAVPLPQPIESDDSTA